MTVRGVASGEYIVNIHLYSTKGLNTGPMPVHVEILKINPYSEIYSGVTTLQLNGQEETVLRFTVNQAGDVISQNKLQKRFAGKHLRPSESTVSGGNSAPLGARGNAFTNDIPDIPADDDEVHSSEFIPPGSSPEERIIEEGRSTYTIGGGGQVEETDEELNRFDGPSHPNSNSDDRKEENERQSMRAFEYMGGGF